MKKIVRLTESDLVKIVKRVIMEQGGQAQVVIDQMAKDTQATLAGTIGKVIVGSSKAAGSKFPIKSVKATSNPERGIITATFNIGGTSEMYVEIGTVVDPKNPKGVRSGIGPVAAPVDYANVVKYMKFTFSRDLIDFNAKETQDAIKAIVTGVQTLVNKYSTTGLATK